MRLCVMCVCHVCVCAYGGKWAWMVCSILQLSNEFRVRVCMCVWVCVCVW